MAKGGAKNPRAKLTFQDVQDIRFQYKLDKESGTKYATIDLLAKEYNVSCATIQEIVTYQSWKE